MNTDVSLTYLTIDEVATLSGLSRSAIYRNAKVGKFPKQVRLSGRKGRWTSDSINKWLNNPGPYAIHPRAKRKQLAKESATAEPAKSSADAEQLAAFNARIARMEVDMSILSKEVEEMRSLVFRARRYVEFDSRMMADISRHAPLDPASQAKHDATKYESERLLKEIDAMIVKWAVSRYKP